MNNFIRTDPASLVLMGVLRPQDTSAHATLVQANPSIYPPEVGFLVLGIWTPCHEIPVPRTSSEDQSAIINVLVWANHGRNGGRGRPLAPLFSRPPPQWGH